MSIWTVLPCSAVISNRPFAHCCQIFTERNFPGAFFCFEKSKEIYLFFFVALICYKDIIANLSNFVKRFLEFPNRGLCYYTNIKAYISKFVKSFLQIFPVRFTTASVSTYYILLDCSSQSRRLGQRVRSTLFMNVPVCKTNLTCWPQPIVCTFIYSRWCFGAGKFSVYKLELKEVLLLFKDQFQLCI